MEVNCQQSGNFGPRSWVRLLCEYDLYAEIYGISSCYETPLIIKWYPMVNMGDRNCILRGETIEIILLCEAYCLGKKYVDWESKIRVSYDIRLCFCRPYQAAIYSVYIWQGSCREAAADRRLAQRRVDDSRGQGVAASLTCVIFFLGEIFFAAGCLRSTARGWHSLLLADDLCHKTGMCPSVRYKSYVLPTLSPSHWLLDNVIKSVHSSRQWAVNWLNNIVWTNWMTLLV